MARGTLLSRGRYKPLDTSRPSSGEDRYNKAEVDKTVHETIRRNRHFAVVFEETFTPLAFVVFLEQATSDHYEIGESFTPVLTLHTAPNEQSNM